MVWGLYCFKIQNRAKNLKSLPCLTEKSYNFTKISKYANAC